MREDLIKRCREWLDNLSSKDIDLIDKVYNLEIENELVEDLINQNDYLRSEIEKEVIKALQLNKDKYIEEIVDSTTSMYEDGLIDEAEDFSSGLYNMDHIYFEAINNTFALGRDIVLA